MATHFFIIKGVHFLCRYISVIRDFEFEVRNLFSSFMGAILVILIR